MLKNNLLHKYRQEGSLGFNCFVESCLKNYLVFLSCLLLQLRLMILKKFFSCYFCSLLKQMSNTSLNLFAERFEAFNGTRIIVLIAG